jgi:tetratricopeptide (TPR) repeat protein
LSKFYTLQKKHEQVFVKIYYKKGKEMKILVSLVITIIVISASLIFISAESDGGIEQNMAIDSPEYDQARLPIYLKKVRDDPKDAASWGALAYVIRSSSKFITGRGENKNNNNKYQQEENNNEQGVVEVKGKKYTKRDCYIKALTLNPQMHAVWYNLGVELGQDLDRDKITVDGKEYNRLDCLIRSVEVQPKASLSWYNLGTMITDYPERFGKDASVIVKGQKVSQTQCYANALNNDNRIANGWNNLGTSIPHHGKNKFAIVDGVKYTRKACFIEELENNPKHGSAWYNLATELETGKHFAKISDVKYTRRQCLINAIKYGPNNPGPWHNLATLLHPKEKITLDIEANALLGFPTKRKLKNLNATQCETEALKLNPQLAIAWFGAGTKMQEGERLDFGPNFKQIGGIEKRYFNQSDAYVKAIEIEPNWADPWNNLATTVRDPTEDRIFIPALNKSFNQKQLLIESINRDPETARTWRNLCMVMTTDEKLIVDGGEYTQFDCDRRADELEKENKK